MRRFPDLSQAPFAGESLAVAADRSSARVEQEDTRAFYAFEFVRDFCSSTRALSGQFLVAAGTWRYDFWKRLLTIRDT